MWILAKKLTPILAFAVLWTIVILKLLDWKYFNSEVAVFLLVPVLIVLFVAALTQVMKHRERMARIQAKYYKREPTSNDSFNIDLGNMSYKFSSGELLILKTIGNWRFLGTPEKVTVGELSRKLGLTRKQVQQYVRGLYKKSLITGLSSKDIWLTEAGEKLYRKMMKM